MRILTTLPQDDLTRVPAVARAAEAARRFGGVADAVGRIPSAFTGFRAEW